MSSFFDNLIEIEKLENLLKPLYKKSSIYKLVGEGMPHTKIGKRLFFEESEVKQWLLEKRRVY